MVNQLKGPSSKVVTTFKYAIGLAANLRSRLVYRITKKPLPFPTVFQIQTNNLCNGSCLMCPISKEKSRKPGEMSDELFEKLIREIAEKRTERAFVLLYLQNEPLTDKNIFRKLKLVKKLSNGLIETGFVTNGTLFTGEAIKELCEAEVDNVFFSVDATKEETYNKIRRGLSYQKVLENIEKIRISNCKTRVIAEFAWQRDNYFEIDDFKKTWEPKGVKTFVQTVNNRAGTVANFDDIRLTHKDFRFRKNFVSILELIITGGCWELVDHINILYNGDVIMCCNDYDKKIILGNVKNNSIEEIWNSKKYQAIREAIFNRDFRKIPGCRDCSSIKYS